jgi:hypothetical protein
MPDERNERTILDEDGALETLLTKNARVGSCPPPELLFAADEDVLSQAEGEAIRAHAAECSLCQTLLARLGSEDGAAAPILTPGQDSRIRARIADGLLRSPETPQEEGRSPWRLRLAIAAVLVFSIGGLFALRHRQQEKDATISASHTDQSATGTTGPLEFAELHKISPLAPPDDAPVLVSRGDSSAATTGPSTADMLPAFRAYNKGDFSAAATAFAPLVARYPQAETPLLYLGVSQLELGENATARFTLTRAATAATSERRAAATWYLAVAELRTGDMHAAVPLLQSLCSPTATAYAPRACALATQASERR